MSLNQISKVERAEESNPFLRLDALIQARRRPVARKELTTAVLHLSLPWKGPCCSCPSYHPILNGLYTHVGWVGDIPENSKIRSKIKSEKRRVICTFDGYELIFRLSYLDSGPRMSTSSLLCLMYSIGAIFRTSCMMDKNLTQLRNSF
jgi:hypothetical protein